MANNDWQDVPLDDWRDSDASPVEIDERSLPGRVFDAGSDALKWVGHNYDKYVTAPARSVVMEEIQHGLSGKPISAFKKQFGANPATAPTGQDIVESLGVPNRPVTSGEGSLLRHAFPALSLGHDLLPDATRNAIDKTTISQAAGKAADIGIDPLLLGAGPISGAKAIGTGVKNAASLLKSGGGLALNAGIKGADLLAGSNKATQAAEGVKDTYQIAKASAEAVANTLRDTFRPKQAADWPKFEAIAKKNGIDPSILPESVEFGRGSAIDSAARARREGLAGQPHHDTFLDANSKVQNAFDTTLSKAAGGPVLDPTNAGVSLRSGYNEGLRNFFDSMDLTHDKILDYAPGLYVDRDAMATVASKVNGIEKYAKGLIARGIDDADQTQGRYLLNAVQQIRNANGSYKQMTEALRSIGRKAFGPSVPGQIPHDIEKLRELYFSTDEALLNTVRKHVNPDFADELSANNAAMSAMFKNKDQVAHIIADSGVAPENAFQRVVLNGDTDQIAALKQILSPEEFAKQRAAFVGNLIKREPDQSFNFNQLYSALRNKQPQLDAWFSGDPAGAEQLKSMLEQIELGKRFGKEVLSTSGTGASNVFHNIKKNLTGAITDDVVLEKMKASARGRTPAIPPPAATRPPSGAVPNLTPPPDGASKPLPFYLLEGSRPLSPSPERSPGQDNSRTPGGWGMDRLQDAVKTNPQSFGKFAGPLQSAEKRGGTALNAAHFVLQQTNEEYRNMIKQLQGDDAQDAGR